MTEIATITRGIATYERGIEVVTVEGYIETDASWVLVYGDPGIPARQQRHTAIPMSRVVEIDFIP